MTLVLYRLARVDSTQAFLERHPELGPCGVLADCQTAGRGQRGNRWESAPGAGLWLSARLPAPRLAPGVVLQRAMAAAAEVLEPWGVDLGLKWPNDLVAWRDGRLVKLGGIIGQIKGDDLILGMGVNLRGAPVIPERPIPPACLAQLLPAGSALPEPLDLAPELLAAWEDLDTHREPLFRWPGAGDPVRWEEGQGVCQGWEEDGRLAVLADDGLRHLVAGDVRGLAGPVER